MTIEIYTHFGRVAKVLTSAHLGKSRANHVTFTPDKLGMRAIDDARAELLKLERETGNAHWMRTK